MNIITGRVMTNGSAPHTSRENGLLVGLWAGVWCGRGEYMMCFPRREGEKKGGEKVRGDKGGKGEWSHGW